MGGHLQSTDSIIALSVTAGILFVGTLFYYQTQRSTAPVKVIATKKAKPVIVPKTPTSSTTKHIASSQSNSSVQPSNGIQSKSSLEMKGYKMTSDGRKTTYFNREMTEEEKVLLGDSTPKPLSSTTSSVSDKIDGNIKPVVGSSTGSAWNTAGTWEERNVTAWAIKHVKELLKLPKVNIIVNSKEVGTLGITKINSVEGDALITMTRGKKKFLYDFTISLDWKIQIGLNAFSGSVIVNDVNAECNYEFEVSSSASNAATTATRDNILKYAKSKNDGLQDILRKQFDTFLVDIKALNS